MSDKQLTAPLTLNDLLGYIPSDKARAEAKRRVAQLQQKIEAARKILEPLADCDADIREWLGLPRYSPPPYPFCHTPDECAGRMSCPKDIACND